jgi:hypothetical protein
MDYKNRNQREEALKEEGQGTSNGYGTAENLIERANCSC